MAQTYDVTLVNLIERFGSEDKCRAYLESLRWPNGIECPRCKCKTISRIHERNQFDCDSCRYQFSVTSGTIMHDTKLPLWKWFLAVYMIVESKKGVSANQLMRSLDVAYRTAWYLCHRIRHALTTPEGLLTGVVEIDETIIGGKAKSGSVKGGKAKTMDNKAWVAGAVQRNGDVRLKHIPDRSGKTLRQFIVENVGTDAERIITDEYRGYDWISKRHLHVQRGRVKHSAEIWAIGDDHTNTIEGAWGLFKRSVVGAFHKISVKHLDRYLDEFEFRFNNRENPFIFRDALGLILAGERMEYAELVG